MRVICLAVLLTVTATAARVAPSLAEGWRLHQTLPLGFEQNGNEFVAHAPEYALRLSARGAEMSSARGAFHMRFLHANPAATLRGEEMLDSTVNYFRGHDPRQWKTGLRTYRSVHYAGIYPGIDIRYKASQGGELEYDFRLAPGANPARIRLAFEGARPLQIDRNGDLVLALGSGELRQRKPAAYQNGSAVESRFVIGRDRTVALAVGPYDRSRVLIIDPVLDYASYFGGSRTDSIIAMALDAAGNIYLTGGTNSADFPVTAGSYSQKYLGGPCPVFNGTINSYCPDVFVSKLNPTGTALIYSTYIGGTGTDRGWGLAVDAAGNVYVTGTTSSTDFPVTPGALGTGLPHLFEASAFLLKLDPSGSKLLYSTYLVGTTDATWSTGSALALSAGGELVVAGATSAPDFPVRNALQPHIGGGTCATDYANLTSPCSDAFLMRWRAADMTLEYSTFLGGSGNDAANAVAVDPFGNAYVAGMTESQDFPLQNAVQARRAPGHCQVQQTFPGSIDIDFYGCADGFVARISADGSQLVYSTYLGGNSADTVNAIAVDASGSAYVAGTTLSTDFPTANAFQPQAGGGVCNVLGVPYGACTDAFVAKFSPDGSQLMYSTYLGGTSRDEASAIAVDSRGNAYVGGWTASRTGFPITPDAIQHCNRSSPAGGGSPGFLTVLNPEGALISSSMIPPASFVHVVVLGAAGHVYVAGSTERGYFSVTAGAFEANSGSAFFAVLDYSASPAAVPTIDQGCVLNAASYQPSEAGSDSIVSPGEIVSIFGSHLGPQEGVGAVLDANGRITTSLAGVSVTFDGIPAPLLYVQAGQVNAIVPFAVAGRQQSVVQIHHQGGVSNGETVRVADRSAGIFTVGALGNGQVLALNQDGTLNSPDNPARGGEIVTLWATGVGLLSSAYSDGEIASGPPAVVVNPPSIFIGSSPAASVQYVGQAPGLVAGAIQINAWVPKGGGAGPAVPIGIANIYQRATIAVR